MKLLITGVCGFVGNALAQTFLAAGEGVEITGIDNLSRPGSELNVGPLRRAGVRVVHGDIRQQADVDALPKADWVIDAAANPSVLAGIDGKSSSRQLLEHNLGGTINLLEYCRRHEAGFILLSTSRVYSIPSLAALPVTIEDGAFILNSAGALPAGISNKGIAENFSTAAPVSLYGATKLASEVLALEYHYSFGLPVWINRCGVLGGAGQFGKADQGIFCFWIHSWAQKRPLKYIGFGGEGGQVRDCLHPNDLVPILRAQMKAGTDPSKPSVLHLSGGITNSMSLRQLSQWCEDRFGPHPVAADLSPRPFDLPWVVLDATAAARFWGWTPETPLQSILDALARHAEANPGWLDLTGA